MAETVVLLCLRVFWELVSLGYNNNNKKNLKKKKIIHRAQWFTPVTSVTQET
jgi:hypothetical protein